MLHRLMRSPLLVGCCLLCHPSFLRGEDTQGLLLGTVFPLTGPQQAYGVEALEGVLVALESLKKEDPQLAAKIKLLQGDDHSTPAGARQAAEALLLQKADVLLGSVTSTTTLAVAEVSRRQQAPLVIPAVTAYAVGPASPYVFRSCATDPWQGSQLAELALTSLGKKKTALLLNPLQHTQNLIAGAFEKAYTAGGGEVVLKELLPAQKPAWINHINNIAAAGAQLVLFPTESYQEAAAVMQEIHKAKLGLTLLGTHHWQHPALPKAAGPAYPGHYFVLPFARGYTSPKIADFVSQFQARMKRYPSALAAMTFDATVLVAEAFKRAGTNKASELLRHLSRSRNVEGLLGLMSMNADQALEKPGLAMLTSQGGWAFKALVPPPTTLHAKKS